MLLLLYMKHKGGQRWGGAPKLLSTQFVNQALTTIWCLEKWKRTAIALARELMFEGLQCKLVIVSA